MVLQRGKILQEDRNRKTICWTSALGEFVKKKRSQCDHKDNVVYMIEDHYFKKQERRTIDTKVRKEI